MMILKKEQVFLACRNTKSRRLYVGFLSKGPLFFLLKYPIFSISYWHRRHHLLLKYDGFLQTIVGRFLHDYE